ncbi:hypothetical protein VTN77DRAFT_5130 [Rasamsonia byssochlamydoides]|uniref:uncharacterized protein n=1 Tax=Rasamsonia byssochlamydoides TaxID=89139 RepID=UPI0037436E0F
MLLKGILQKKDKLDDRSGQPPSSTYSAQEIRFIRSDTHTEEAISPPIFDDDRREQSSSSSRRRGSFLHRHPHSPGVSPTREKGEGLISNLLHVDRQSPRSSSSISLNIPSDLPPIETENGDPEEREAQWEKRATTLIQGDPRLASPTSPLSPRGRLEVGTPEQRRSRSRSNSRVSDPEGDVTIQEAIRLHEAGELERSTQMFGVLADPNGANNALGQVLYGLALRHGWGCTPDPAKAVTYLSAAASNSASVEAEALQAGMKKGGAAKGELVLAIFELANCFRNGWGVKKDPVAARQYYETAANLGDTDAMNEIAWCYLEGFGGKKDKFMAAKYYRLAEQHGNKTLGNSWIWKEKYNPK